MGVRPIIASNFVRARGDGPRDSRSTGGNTPFFISDIAMAGAPVNRKRWAFTLGQG